MQIIRSSRDLSIAAVNGLHVTPSGYVCTWGTISCDGFVLDPDAVTGIRPGKPVFISPDAPPAGVIRRVSQDACGIQIVVRQIGDTRTCAALGRALRRQQITRFALTVAVRQCRPLTDAEIQARFGIAARWVVEAHPVVTLIERCAVMMIGFHLPAGVTIPQASSPWAPLRPTLVEDGWNGSSQAWAWLFDD